jgi:hypothetical protein
MGRAQFFGAARSTTMAILRLAAASGSAGNSGSRSALPVMQPRLRQQPAGGVGALGRKLPVGLLAAAIGCGVGVAGNRDVLLQFGQRRSDLEQQRASPVQQHRRAGGEHRLEVLVEDLDA